MERFFWIIWWTQCNHKCFHEMEDAGGAREDDVMMEAETGMIIFENGGRGRKPRNTGGP